MGDTDNPKKSGTSGAIARKYEKMSPREHVLRRPDTYIGSIGVIEEVHDVVKDGRIQSVEMAYTPGLAKVFDECLVNALDHVVRVAETGGPKSTRVSEISVTIDKDSGVLGVFNDGDGIDVVEHPVYKVYVPQLVFGELLTSTNYDDSGLEKLWGGRNGYGAKLANIWADWFEVETFDRVRGLSYKQRFEKNMSVVGRPKVRAKKSGKPFTRVTFLPDYARMHLNGLSDDMAALLSRRVFDAAACTPSNVSVLLNGDKVPIKAFKDYVSIFDVEEGRVAYFSTRNGRWDIALAPSTNGTFEHVSFVNGISTRKGGTHVNMVANLIAKTMSALATKKAGANVKTSYIKDNMRLFIRCVVPDPTFGSQTKEELTSPASKFSGSFDIKQSDIAKLAKNSGVMERAEALMQFHENRLVKASAGKKQARLIIPKLDDANNAGTKRSGDCTLILTEGDSAKTMAISGLAVVGRDNYGVFPLRGKLLNISDKSTAASLKNEEVANIVKILGLKPGQTNTIGDLRYGRVMIMADADDDGIHIRALVINLFRVMFPELFKTDAFLVSMLTPVIKAKTSKDSHDFYSVRDFKAWQAKHPKSAPVVKYLKGLGSSTSSDAKQYFKDMRLVEYTYSKESDDRMSLAFSKARADDRKLWLMSYTDASALPDYTRKQVDYATFVDTELIRFSIRDCARSLPHIMDGLKESTRKILFGAMKHTPRDSHIKVAQLAGFVSKVSKYLHGEDSLNKAITGMAQTFPGSNNLALLDQDGQFGCLSPDSEVVTWDAGLKKARDVNVGDRLVGDDGSARTVLRTTRGQDEMYCVSMENGQDYTVNSRHILTLALDAEECSDVHDVIDMELSEYMRLPIETQNRCRCVLNSTPVAWDARDVPADPYTVGTGLRYVHFLNKCYKHNDVDIRRSVLAGLVDSHGSLCAIRGTLTVDVSDFSQGILSAIQFIARSLGLVAQVTRVYPDSYGTESSVLTVMGYGVALIPCKTVDVQAHPLGECIASVHHVKFSVKPVGVGEFSGWSLDGNERFLLGSFAVTHNSRLLGGEDRASPRYIHTRLADIATKVFRPEDDVILEYKSDEGATIEPVTYYPIIPMVLVNGVISIATGFSCSIPMFDPADLIQAILDHLDGKKMRKLTPWFRGWNGRVEADGKGGFVSSGRFSRGKGNAIIIEELPAYRWTEDQKVMLEDLMVQGVVKNFRSQYTDTSVRFDVEFANQLSDDEVIGALQLRSNRNLSTSNVHLFSVDGSVTKFDTLDDLMRIWLRERSEKYAQRKLAVLATLRDDLVILSAKARFISEVVSGTIKVMDAKADKLSAKLKERKFPLDENRSYEYLLKLPINQLTRERKDKLLAHEKLLKSDVAKLNKTSPEDLWRKDLDELKSAWSQLLKESP